MGEVISDAGGRWGGDEALDGIARGEGGGGKEGVKKLS